MPYADPDVARAKAREYMRKLRAQRAALDPKPVLAALERLAAADALTGEHKARLQELAGITAPVMPRRIGITASVAPEHPGITAPVTPRRPGMQIERRRVDASSIAWIPFEGAERPLNARLVKRLALELRHALRYGLGPDSGFNNPIELAELREEEQPDPGKRYRIVAGFHRCEAWLHAKAMRERGDPDYSHLICTVYTGAKPEQLLYLHLRSNLNQQALSPGERKVWLAALEAIKSR